MAADKPQSEILGGGFTVGSLVMVMEDTEAPHHMLLWRNFMSQGLVHHQPLIYASPSKNRRGFLGILPTLMAPRDDKSHVHVTEQERGLRIACNIRSILENRIQNPREVPAILEATTFSMKLQKRRSLVLEYLNQAPVDSSSGTSYSSSGGCSSMSSKTGALDF